MIFDSATKNETSVGLALGEQTILDENGKQVLVKTLWERTPVVLIFLRHFACIACRAHAREVWNQRRLYEANGTKIAFVGCGSPENIARFRREMHLEGAPIYTDPGLNAFSAAGFKRSFLGSLGFQAAANFLNLASRGYWQTKHRTGDGDKLQLGGVVLVMPDGHVRYKYTSTATGDFPTHSDLEHKAMSRVRPFTVEAVAVAASMPDYSTR